MLHSRREAVMRARGLTAGIVLAALALVSPALAQPVKMRHGTVDDRFTTRSPGAPSGFTYHGAYHAAGDASAPPPYLRPFPPPPPPPRPAPPRPPRRTCGR